MYCFVYIIKMDETVEELPLHRAVKEKQALLVPKIIEQDPSQLNAKDKDGRTPLFWAISLGGPDVTSAILSYVSKNQGSKALKDFDIDETDESGWTALHVAASVGTLDTVSKLAELGADVNAQTNAGQTPLHFAVSKDHKNVAEYLIGHGASVRARDKMNQNPLFRAASMGNATMVNLLIKAGCPLNTSDVDGWTPLHHAYAEGHGDIVVLLIKAGADADKANSDGKIPAQVAVDDKVREHVQRELKQ